MCGGYSRILQCVLNSVGIECNYIGGSTNKERDLNHAWNQVKIDNKWYNVDLTWDRDDFEDDMLIENCLVSDEDFFNHIPLSGDYVECKETYDRKSLEKCIIENLSPVYKLKFMKLQKEKEEQEKIEIGKIKLEPWDLRNYSNSIGVIYKNKNRDKDDEIER